MRFECVTQRMKGVSGGESNIYLFNRELYSISRDKPSWKRISNKQNVRGCGGKSVIQAALTLFSTPESRELHQVQKGSNKDFPGGPMVNTQHFKGKGHGFDPWS